MTRSTTAPRGKRGTSTRNDDQLGRLIREKAYELYQRRGGSHGDDQADWFEAERLVRQSRLQTAGSAARTTASRGKVEKGRATSSRRKRGRRAGA